MTMLKPLLSMPKYASGNIGGPSLEKQTAESVTGGEEHEDHQGHDQRHGADHREHGWAVAVHLEAPPGGADARASSGAGEAPACKPACMPTSRSPTRYTEPVASTAASCSRAQRWAPASDCSAAGESARLLGGAVNHARSHAPSSGPSMPAASLSSSTPSTSASGRPAIIAGSDCNSAATASGLWAASS